MKNAAIAAILLAATVAAAQAQTVVVTDDFEGAAPAGFTRQFGFDGAGSAALSSPGEPALGSRSVKLTIPDVTDYGVVSLLTTGTGIGKLRDVALSFDSYIDPSSQYQGSVPYGQFGLDSNNDGFFDSSSETLIIAFSSNVPPAAGVWQNQTLTGVNAVHVPVGRGQLPGSGDNNFMSDETPDFLSELYNLNYDANTLFGDLNVLRIRAATGLYDGSNLPTQNQIAYIDNLSASVVPEPAALAAIVGGAVLLLGRRRRRA